MRPHLFALLMLASSAGPAFADAPAVNEPPVLAMPHTPRATSSMPDRLIADAAPRLLVYLGTCAPAGWAISYFRDLPPCSGRPLVDHAPIAAKRGTAMHENRPGGAVVDTIVPGTRVELLQLVRTSDYNGDQPDHYWGEVARTDGENHDGNVRGVASTDPGENPSATRRARTSTRRTRPRS